MGRMRDSWAEHPLAYLAHTYYLQSRESWDDARIEDKVAFCREMLKRNRDELANSDPLIPLLAQKERYKKPNIAFGKYKLTTPSMKVLNDDTPLGRQGADELMVHLNDAVEVFISHHSESYGFLGTYFKGGSFVVDMDAYEPGPRHVGKNKEDALHDAFHQFTEFLNAALPEFIERYIQGHPGLGPEKRGQLRTMAAGGLKMSFGLSAIEHRTEMTDDEWLRAAGKASAFAQVAMNETHDRITDPNVPASIQERRSPLTFFRIENLRKDVQRVYGATLAKVTHEPSRYEGLFILDGDELTMHDKAMAAHRSGTLEEYCPNPELRADFVTFFNLVNRFDIVNPYTAETADNYFGRLPGAVKHYNQLTEAIGDEGASFDKLYEIFLFTSEGLTMSRRQCTDGDAADGLRMSTRGVIMELMEDGEHWLVVGDHVGFSLLNFKSMLKLAYKVFKTGQLTEEDLMTVLDGPTRFLRSIEMKIRAVFPNASIGGDGGDEVEIVIPREDADPAKVKAFFDEHMPEMRAAGFLLPVLNAEDVILTWAQLTAFTESAHSGVKWFNKEKAAQGSPARASSQLVPANDELVRHFVSRSRYDVSRGFELPTGDVDVPANEPGAASEDEENAS